MGDFCADHSAHRRAISKHDEKIDKLAQENTDIKECVIRLTALQEQNATRIEDIDHRLSAIEDKPAEFWDHIMKYALTGSIGVVAGIVASQTAW